MVCDCVAAKNTAVNAGRLVSEMFPLIRLNYRAFVSLKKLPMNDLRINTYPTKDVHADIGESFRRILRGDMNPISRVYNLYSQNGQLQIFVVFP